MLCVLSEVLRAVCNRKAFRLPVITLRRVIFFLCIFFVSAEHHGERFKFLHLELVVDDHGVSASVRVFGLFFLHLFFADEDSKQFRCQLWHFHILLCLCHKLSRRFFLSIQLSDTFIQALKFEFSFGLFLLISARHFIVSLNRNSADSTIFIQTADNVVYFFDTIFELILLLFGICIILFGIAFCIAAS